MPKLIDATTKALGEEVKRRRVALGLTLPDLAARTGITQNYIGSIENGYRDPCIRSVLKLAKGLECHIGQLFGSELAGSHLTPAGLEAAEITDGLPTDTRRYVLGILRILGSI